jgi:acetyl-CoA C-acetyltransferase
MIRRISRPWPKNWLLREDFRVALKIFFGHGRYNFRRKIAMSNKEIVIIGGCRSAIGSFEGVTAAIPATQLGSEVIKNLLERSHIDPALVDEVIMGQVYTGGAGMNPARQSSMGGGLSQAVPAFTVNKVCGSGLKAVILAAEAISSGNAEVVIAGGQESMSLAPHVLPHSRKGQRINGWILEDSMIKDGLEDVFNHYHMGMTAENLAEKYGISRQRQDEEAYFSQMKTKEAMDKGRFKDEIVSVTIPQKKNEPIIFDKDEHPRPNTTIEALSKLSPGFKKDGTVTAGNSTGMNNGAAAVMVTSRKKALELGVKPLVKIVATASVGLDPKIMGLGPVYASQKCLKKALWTVNDLDLIEANEVFAVQGLAVNQEMGWDTKKVNVNGSAIALGHPIGASGARLLVTLIYAMIHDGVKRGLATLCVGGGMGIAMAIERE